MAYGPDRATFDPEYEAWAAQRDAEDAAQDAALTDLTREWLWKQRNEEPHKGGWLTLTCWVDAHSYADHAVTCADCRAHAQQEVSRG